MLREIRPARQKTRNAIRRWFTDADMDLFIWFTHQVPVKFQLSYDKREAEHVLSWDRERGFMHNRIDDGEGLPGRYKMSPIMVSGSSLDTSKLARNFLIASEAMDPALADFIYARLLEYPGFKLTPPGQGGLSTNL